MERVFRLLTMCFGSLAGFASINILPDVWLDVRPPVVPCNEFLSFVLFEVPCGDTVVMLSDNVFSKAFILWDIDSLFPSNNASFICFFFLAKAFSTTLSFVSLEALILVRKLSSRDLKVKTYCWKCFGLSKTMFSLSFPPLLRSGCFNKISGLIFVFPGLWCKL